MSDPPRGREPIGYEHWVADCLAVLDAAGSTGAVVLGQEHAGPAAIRLAHQARRRITGLVLHTVLSARTPTTATSPPPSE